MVILIIRGLVRLVALVQDGHCLGEPAGWRLMKGFRDAAGNALSLIVGSLVGVAAYYGCYRLGGYEGALLGPGADTCAGRYPCRNNAD
ncbi:lipid III flippase [Citrobacter freundii]|nr:lipid III flippase [Citrobacter freundii]